MTRKRKIERKTEATREVKNVESTERLPPWIKESQYNISPQTGDSSSVLNLFGMSQYLGKIGGQAIRGELGQSWGTDPRLHERYTESGSASSLYHCDQQDQATPMEDVTSSPSQFLKLENNKQNFMDIGYIEYKNYVPAMKDTVTFKGENYARKVSYDGKDNEAHLINQMANVIKSEFLKMLDTIKSDLDSTIKGNNNFKRRKTKMYRDFYASNMKKSLEKVKQLCQDYREQDRPLIVQEMANILLFYTDTSVEEGVKANNEVKSIYSSFIRRLKEVSQNTDLPHVDHPAVLWQVSNHIIKFNEWSEDLVRRKERLDTEGKRLNEEYTRLVGWQADIVARLDRTNTYIANLNRMIETNQKAVDNLSTSVSQGYSTLMKPNELQLEKRQNIERTINDNNIRLYGISKTFEQSKEVRASALDELGKIQDLDMNAYNKLLEAYAQELAGFTAKKAALEDEFSRFGQASNGDKTVPRDVSDRLQAEKAERDQQTEEIMNSYRDYMPDVEEAPHVNIDSLISDIRDTVTYWIQIGKDAAKKGEHQIEIQKKDFLYVAEKFGGDPHNPDLDFKVRSQIGKLLQSGVTKSDIQSLLHHWGSIGAFGAKDVIPQGLNERFKELVQLTSEDISYVNQLQEYLLSELANLELNNVRAFHMKETIYNKLQSEKPNDERIFKLQQALEKGVDPLKQGQCSEQDKRSLVLRSIIQHSFSFGETILKWENAIGKEKTQLEDLASDYRYGINNCIESEVFRLTGRIYDFDLGSFRE